jgi:II/X family phage/plasmid replication protein
MWAVETGRNELAKALEGVQMPQNVKLGGIAVEGLPLWLRPTYELWGAGVDVRTALSRATYFRHRQVLLGLGVDISRPPYGEEFNAPRPANVVPFVKTYEGKLKGIPEWALGTELLYEPKAACGGE